MNNPRGPQWPGSNQPGQGGAPNQPGQPSGPPQGQPSGPPQQGRPPHPQQGQPPQQSPGNRYPQQQGYGQPGHGQQSYGHQGNTPAPPYGPYGNSYYQASAPGRPPGSGRSRTVIIIGVTAALLVLVLLGVVAATLGRSVTAEEPEPGTTVAADPTDADPTEAAPVETEPVETDTAGNPDEPTPSGPESTVEESEPTQTEPAPADDADDADDVGDGGTQIQMDTGVAFTVPDGWNAPTQSGPHVRLVPVEYVDSTVVHIQAQQPLSNPDGQAYLDLLLEREFNGEVTGLTNEAVQLDVPATVQAAAARSVGTGGVFHDDLPEAVRYTAYLINDERGTQALVMVTGRADDDANLRQVFLQITQQIGASQG